MRSKILGLLAVGLLAGPVIGHTASLYSNLGPGNSFQTGVGWAAGSGFSPVGVQFTAAATGEVASVDLGFSCTSNCPTLTTFGLYSNTATNEIGSLIESFSVSAGNPFGQGALSTGALSGSSTLDAGSVYWLVLTSSESQGLLAWNWNSTGQMGRMFDAGNGYRYLTLGAFRINGVPEPGTLALLGLGLAALGLSRRRATH